MVTTRAWRRLAQIWQGVTVGIVLLALFLQCYGLYLAVPLAPQATWRRRLARRLRRAYIQLDLARVSAGR